MPVFQKTKEYPADHPIHRGLIFFGRKPPSSSESPLPEFPLSDLTEEQGAQLLLKLFAETVKLKTRFTSKPAVDPSVGSPDESL